MKEKDKRVELRLPAKEKEQLEQLAKNAACRYLNICVREVWVMNPDLF